MGMIIMRSESNVTPPLKHLTHLRHDTVHKTQDNNIDQLFPIWIACLMKYF